MPHNLDKNNRNHITIGETVQRLWAENVPGSAAMQKVVEQCGWMDVDLHVWMYIENMYIHVCMYTSMYTFFV